MSDYAICRNCGRRYEFETGYGGYTGGDFCCEGCYKEFYRKKEEDAERESERRASESARRARERAQSEQEELEEYERQLKKQRLDAEHRDWMKTQVIELDPKKLGIPLDEAWGNKGDWNGVEIQDKKSWKVSDGKLTLKIGRIQNDAKGPTGTLRITFEWIHSDGSREICAKFYRNKLEAGYGYPDIEATVGYT
ncbi:MAG: hypothetical protein II811_07535, partial [Spirochaetaceae bacterium]|nr:hypothetical protein [Spirochaetaceae bacterium]